MSSYRLPKIALGAAMVIAAPLSLASWVLVPASMNDGSDLVRETFDAGRAAANASVVTGALFFPAAVLAVLGLVHLLRDRTGNFASLAGGLAIVGLTLNALALGAGIALSEVVFSDLTTTDKVAIVDATNQSSLWVLPIVGVALAALGFLGLGVALSRAGTIPKTAALALIAYGPIQVIGFATLTITVITISYVVMAVAFIPAGIVVLSENADTWQRPPVVHGFRPAGAARTRVA